MKIGTAFRLSTATLLAAASLGASAESTFHPSNNEAGTVYHSVKGPISKPASDQAIIINENWDFKGGDTGWELRQHAYDFRNGRLAHADAFSHDSPKPVLSAKELTARNVEAAGG